MIARSGPLTGMFHRLSNKTFPPIMRSCRHNGAVFFPKSPTRQMCFLLGKTIGLSQICRTNRRVAMTLLQRGDIFNILSLVANGHSSHFCRSITFAPMRLLSIPVRRIRRTLRRGPRLTVIVLQKLSSHVLRARVVVRALTRQSVKSHLIDFLLVLYHSFNIPDRSNVAVSLGLSRRTVTRTVNSAHIAMAHLLKSLHRRNVVSVCGGGVAIRSPIGLDRRFA